jgi:alpha-amylase
MELLLRGTSRAALAVALLALDGCAKETLSPNAGAPVAVAPASSNATVVNGVMMQGFYWDVPTSTPAGTWWQNLGSKATELSQTGITAMWLPPTYKGSGALDVGYGV